jgi:hypothetical protein
LIASAAVRLSTISVFFFGPSGAYAWPHTERVPQIQPASFITQKMATIFM